MPFSPFSISSVSVEPVKNTSEVGSSLSVTKSTLMSVLFSPDEKLDPLFTDQGNDLSHTSYLSYFNAFPASYWQNNTDVRSVALSLEIQGKATLTLSRSDAQGRPTLLESQAIDSGAHEFTAQLTGFERGGFLWFEVSDQSKDFSLVQASWNTDSAPVRDARLSIGITTFNKPDYCVKNLHNIASDSELFEHLDVIYLVDQGTQLVSDEPGIEEVQALLGDKLHIIRQANLGGSGGFSRSMYEALKADSSTQLLLLDDDVNINTESIKRALRFASFTKVPTIVGGHMFDLNFPTVLHAFSEIVKPVEFFWTQRDPEHYRHNFKKRSLANTSWMHEYLPADYNGWWMCMIPVEVIREVGLGLPMFIKWDDAEYGLRAKKAGYPTVSLPGVALWHVSWLDKDDAQDWQAYFHIKNRFIAALLHSDVPGGGVLVKENEKHNLKRLLAMQYYSVRSANNALKDVLDTSINLHDVLAQVMPEARAIANHFEETIKYTDENKPVSQRGRLNYTDFDAGRPTGVNLLLWLARNFPRHLMTRSHKAKQPQVEFPKLQATWWRVAKYNSYLVESSAKDGYFWFNRDQRRFRELIKDSRQLHAEMRTRWNELQDYYRSQLTSLASPEAWEQHFAQHTSPTAAEKVRK